jgi:hypothetical protein
MGWIHGSRWSDDKGRGERRQTEKDYRKNAPKRSRFGGLCLHKLVLVRAGRCWFGVSLPDRRLPRLSFDQIFVTKSIFFANDVEFR